MKTSEGTYWFKRLLKDIKRISPHIRVVRLKMGFYRIYWQNAYIHEVYKEMPQIGYDIYEEDPRIESKSYYEEYEDNVELTRKIKNFVEGYYDSLDTIKTRVYLMRNNAEYAATAARAYQQMVIK
jgi:hypothetical protein